MQYGHPGVQNGATSVQNVATGQHLMMNGHKRMAMKTVTKDDAASHDDEVAMGDIVPIVDIAAFMKQPFTETDF